VPAKWLVLLAVAPITLLFGLLAGLFHQLFWQLKEIRLLNGLVAGIRHFRPVLSAPVPTPLSVSSSGQ